MISDELMAAIELVSHQKVLAYFHHASLGILHPMRVSSRTAMVCLVVEVRLRLEN